MATGSPITLIGGLNTITVSTLGTFTVTLRTGLSGYATSGASCLVTGSPLTLSAGSNTITTTGSTGTFTINIYGTFILTLQSGISGTATSSAATVVGSPVSLVQGTNTIMTSTVGTFTVTLNETKNIVSKTGALQVYVDPSTSGTIDAVDSDWSVQYRHSLLPVIYRFTYCRWNIPEYFRILQRLAAIL